MRYRLSVRWVIIFLFLFSCCSHAGAQERIAPPGVVKEEPPFRKRVYTDKKGVKMPYRLFIPPSYDSSKRYPLIFWFHSGSARGSNNEAQISNENEKGSHLWTMPDNQATFPAFVLAPQCPENEGWSNPELNEVSGALQLAMETFAQVQKDYSIDADRIYLAGQSMGGFGVWSLLQTYPELWAGAVIVSSYDNFTNVRAITRVPLWMFQSEMDMTVPVDLVRQMVRQIKKAGGSPRYTEYHKTKNEVWDEAFAETQLVPWLASQKRGTSIAGPR
jgi:predicted peptidase